MPRFWNARVEIITQKKKKEEQVKREIDKQKRLKKKDPKSSRSVDDNEENLNNKDELSKRHEMIVNQNSSSSIDDDDDLTFGSSLSTELQPDHIVDAAKKPPPPVLPKPKPKKKPKIPPKSPSRAAFVSPNAQELALQLSQVLLKNGTHTKREMAGQNAGDENYEDGCTDTTTDKNKVRVQRNIQRKPILLQQQQLQSAASDHPTVVNNSGHHFTRQDAVNDDDDIENALYSTVNFASLGFHKPYSDSVEPESPEPYAVSNVNHFNYDPKPSHIEETSNRVLSTSKSTPAGHVGQDDHNVLRISPTLGIKEVQSVMNGGTSYSVGENNDLYSLPVNKGRQDGHNMVQVSPTLGIKEVQSVMDVGTSYSVGENNDVYSLPVNNGRQDEQNMVQINSPTLGIKEVQSILKDGTDDSTATDKDTRDSSGYTEPRELHKSEQESKLSTPSNEYETEEPYAETTICFQNSSPNVYYEIPAPFVKTSPPHTPRRKTPLVDYSSKPPNSKPPPPPPGNTPTFETKKKKRIPGFPKPPPLKDIAVTDSSQPPHAELRQKSGRSDSSSSNESTNSKRDVEQIFASRSDIGFTEEDNNNNRHPVIPSPKRNIAYSERSRDLPPLDNHAQDPSQISLNNIASDILIVPPPPPSIPIVDSDAMVVPPPPPMSDNDTSHIPYSAVLPPPPIYPPPRLRPSERAQLYVGTAPKSYSQDGDAESQWLDMVEGLPPPLPDLLEESPLY